MIQYYHILLASTLLQYIIVLANKLTLYSYIMHDNEPSLHALAMGVHDATLLTTRVLVFGKLETICSTLASYEYYGKP